MIARIRRLCNTITYTGIWIQPIMMVALHRVLRLIYWRRGVSWQAWLIAFGLSFLPSLYVWCGNKITRKNGKKKYGLMDVILNKATPYYDTGKVEAMYPDVPAELLYQEPTGVVFGRWHHKYVCHSLANDGHVLVIGGSGTGKSSALAIPTLLCNPDIPILALDIKGELHQKTVKLGEPHVRVMDPGDRNSYGYDPLYGIDRNSSSQEILESVLLIVHSLIPLPANTKDPFWINSARNLLTGLLIYHMKQGKNFIDCMDEILGKPIKNSIDEVAQNVCSVNAEYRYLIQFADMSEVTLSGIFAELANHITIFANDADIRYCFRENRHKVSPVDLEGGNSIYLAIREEKLSAYYDVLQLIFNQTLAYLEKRPEDSKRILILIDELPRILSSGKLEKLLDGIKTLRSRKVTLLLVTQSLEALMAAYSENEVADLVSNCQYISVLSATSTKTQKAICDWCGKFRERKNNYNEGAPKRMSISYDYHNIVEPSDLMTLAKSGESILISPYGYARIEKTPYYKDMKLKKMYENIQTYNKTIKEVED